MKRALLALLLGLAAGASAGAGTIGITISQSAEVREGVLTALVTVTNGGDETALSVTPLLRFLGAEVRGRGRDFLAPGGSFQESLSLSVGRRGRGRWPYALVVDYTDANHSPFQALLVATFGVGDSPPARLVMRESRAGALADSTTLTVAVKNVSNAWGAARLTVFVPRDLEVEQAEGETRLGPGEERTIARALTNRHGLPGSRYPVFAVLEADEGSVHQAAVAQTMVEIVTPEAVAESVRRALWIVAVALLAVWIGLVAFRAVRRKGLP